MSAVLVGLEVSNMIVLGSCIATERKSKFVRNWDAF